MQETKLARLLRRSPWILGVGTAALIGSWVHAADATTNDILGIADFANSGFQKGFAIGIPILILVVMLGWLLYGLTRGVKGKK